MSDVLQVPNAPAPLHRAVLLGKITEVRRLVAAGADVRALDHMGNTALGYLFRPVTPGKMELGHPLQNCGNLSASAVQWCRDKFLALGTDPNAAHRGNHHYGLMPQLANERDRLASETILMLAARCDDLESVEKLLTAGADARTLMAPPDGRSALDIAFEWGCGGALIESLEAAGAPRTQPPTLVRAARRGNAEEVRTLLAAGVHPETPDDGVVADFVTGVYPQVTRANFPITALTVACIRGHADILQILLDAGAEPRSEVARRAGLLARAARQGHVAICRKLLEVGFDPNGETDDFLAFPLGEAASVGQVEVARLLLQAGATIEKQPQKRSDIPKRLWRDLRPENAIKHARSGSGSKAEREALQALLEPGKAKDPTDIALGSFKATATDAVFVEALRWIEDLFGRRTQPWKRRKGVFQIYTKNTAKIATAQAGMRGRGFIAVTGKVQLNGEAVPLRLYPTPDPYAVLRATGVNGANHGLDTDDIISWLRSMEKDHPFELVACGFDFMSGRFQAPVGEKALFLAARMLKFCPDLDSGSAGNSARVLAAELRDKGVFFFWWD